MEDQALLVEIDYHHDEVEHVELKREEKITKAIVAEECFVIMADHQAVGFVILDYRFFDQGWIELIILKEELRGSGIGSRALSLTCQQSKTSKVFTSTNRSNIQMQKVLHKVGFTFAGEINGLDDGDPELFYLKDMSNKKST